MHNTHLFRKNSHRVIYGAIIGLTLIFGMSSVSAADIDLSTGNLVKAGSSSAVYEIAGDGSRLVFQMQSVYESWYGNDFSAVKTISADQMAGLPLKRVKSFKPGSVVKSPSLAKTYRVKDSLVLEGFASEDDFYAEGYDFSQVKDIPDAFFTSYTIASDFEPPKDPEPEPEPEPEPVAFEVLSRTFTADSKKTGRVDVETSLDSTVTLTYNAQDAISLLEKTQTSGNTGLNHSFTLTGLFPRTKYDYSLLVKNVDGTVTIEESGTFVSYYDVYASAHGAAPTDGTLLLPNVEVGNFFVYNNSAETQTIKELRFLFDSLNSATSDVAKTVNIIDDNSSSDTYGDVLAFKKYGLDTRIVGSLSLVRIPFLELMIEPGKQRRFSIQLTNLDQMNKEKMDDLPFITSYQLIELANDSAELYSENNVIGTKYHSLP